MLHVFGMTQHVLNTPLCTSTITIYYKVYIGIGPFHGVVCAFYPCITYWDRKYHNVFLPFIIGTNHNMSSLSYINFIAAVVLGMQCHAHNALDVFPETINFHLRNVMSKSLTSCQRWSVEQAVTWTITWVLWLDTIFLAPQWNIGTDKPVNNAMFTWGSQF